MADQIYPGTTPPPTQYIPGTTVAATETELRALAEQYKHFEETPEVMQWVGPFTPPPGWAEAQEQLRERARWAAKQLGVQPVQPLTVAPALVQPGGHQMSMDGRSLDEMIIAAAGGDNYFTFDEWNWFYQQVTGQPGPAPEDVGLIRSSDGSVLINGQPRYQYATWKHYALEGAGRRKPVQPQPISGNLLTWIKNLVGWIFAGGYAPIRLGA